MTYSFSSDLYLDEKTALQRCFDTLGWQEHRAALSESLAIHLVEKARTAKGRGGQLESFLQEYSLNTEEGLAMMCLAEALLRIPDAHTANLLIRDRISAANWLNTQGKTSKDWISKAAGFGLSLTRKTLESSLSKLGEPIIREAMIHAMQIMGKQFVIGERIDTAIKNARSYEDMGYRMSYDILGEGARDAETAHRYYESYALAIDAIGKNAASDPQKRAGLSVKLSALHPRHTYSQSERCIPEIAVRLTSLARLAAKHNITLTVDAEEAARLNISIAIIEQIMRTPDLAGWEGFGLAVQAYQKRALPLLDHLQNLAQETKRRLQVRIVKGAYWDSEIKWAQIGGFPDYPVYTRKCNTDVSFLACAAKLFAHPDTFYPMLATHNAHTIAAIHHMAKDTKADFEYQRLHGMGESLYAHVLSENLGRVSVYAPVGPHADLLPYLVRRLLENGANSNFVNQILDHKKPAASIVRDPVAIAMAHTEKHHPKIPLPEHIFTDRKNSKGLDFNDPHTSQKTRDFIKTYPNTHTANSIIDGKYFEDTEQNPTLITRAFESTKKAFANWNSAPVDTRCAIILKFADLLAEHRDDLMAILVHEAGKTLPDALAEHREAIDFCHYYAARATEDFPARGHLLQSYTGEENRLLHEGRGTFVCISPWNFPLAIFTGQIVAALLAGNCVIAKPASQTRLIAMRTVRLLHEAGIPENVLHILMGSGVYGAKIIEHPDVAGVAFTGSTATAKSIQRTLAHKDGAIVPLIAETGGQNAMIVDSSCLIEQAVDDILLSAFGSAGQRCSALRVAYIQDDIAGALIHTLKGAMKEIVVGAPSTLRADIGPVIDQTALNMLEKHITYLDALPAPCIGRIALDPDCTADKPYFAPAAYEIPSLSVLQGEVFGPILHIIRFKAAEIDKVITEINTAGFGLTFGLHSRIQNRQNAVTGAVRAGNIYINRSMIGAVVGVQPFGGMGLSGTGPKAGGPAYLHAFATEKHISTNTTASGGNTGLISLDDT